MDFQLSVPLNSAVFVISPKPRTTRSWSILLDCATANTVNTTFDFSDVHDFLAVAVMPGHPTNQELAEASVTVMILLKDSRWLYCLLLIPLLTLSWRVVRLGNVISSSLTTPNCGFAAPRLFAWLRKLPEAMSYSEPWVVANCQSCVEKEGPMTLWARIAANG